MDFCTWFHSIPQTKKNTVESDHSPLPSFTTLCPWQRLHIQKGWAGSIPEKSAAKCNQLCLCHEFIKPIVLKLLVLAQCKEQDYEDLYSVRSCARVLLRRLQELHYTLLQLRNTSSPASTETLHALIHQALQTTTSQRPVCSQEHWQNTLLLKRTDLVILKYNSSGHFSLTLHQFFTCCKWK